MSDQNKTRPEKFQIEELDEKALEAISGGVEEFMQDTNIINCDNNTNCAGGNCVAGCT